MSKFESAFERVVITGMGAITPGGLDVRSNYQSLLSGNSFISQLDNPFNRIKTAGIIRGFDPNIYLHPREQKSLTKDVLLIVGATFQALVNAGLIKNFSELPIKTKEDKANRDEPWLRTKVPARRVGVEIGSAIGGSFTFTDQERDARSIFRLDISQIAGTPAMLVDARGPSNTRVNACASSIIAVGEAAGRIKRGEADVMLAGGGEAPLVRETFVDFDSMKHALSRIEDPLRASRPLDRDYDGFCVAEAASVLVLERLDLALNRDAKIYGEILGYGQTTDTSSPFVPNGYANEEAMQIAVENSGRDLRDFDIISLHAAGTPMGDPQESNAIRRVFGPKVVDKWIYTSKSYYGHALGAAGSMALLQILLSMDNGVMFVNPNQENPIPEAEDFRLPRQNISYRPKLAIANGIGLEGVDASIVIENLNVYTT